MGRGGAAEAGARLGSAEGSVPGSHGTSPLNRSGRYIFHGDPEAAPQTDDPPRHRHATVMLHLARFQAYSGAFAGSAGEDLKRT